VAAQAEHGYRAGGQQHRQEQPRYVRTAPVQQQEESQDGRREGKGGGLDPADTSGERTQLGEECLSGDRNSGDPSELVGDHDQRHSRHVPDQDRPGQQVGRDTQAQQPGHGRHQPDQHRQQGGELGVPHRVAGRQRPDRDRGHQRGRGFRAHRQRG
jgi:hypothetical protein